jgi:hypothetical protein
MRVSAESHARQHAPNSHFRSRPAVLDGTADLVGSAQEGEPMDTSYVAWYAAILSTTVLVWDVAKWWRAEPRLRISARPDVSYPDGEVVHRETLADGTEVATLASYCHVDIVNTGGRSTTLIDVEVMARRAGKTKGEMGVGSVAFTRHRGSDVLPVKLGPGEMWSARIDMRKLDGLKQFGPVRIKARAAHREQPVESLLRPRRRS